MNFILPPRCIATGEIVDRQGSLAPAAWSQLNFIGGNCCGTCGHPFEINMEIIEGTQCASCLAHPPPFLRTRSALVYDDGSRDLILRFKHADMIHAIHAFLPWMKRAGADILRDAALVVPVPLHRFRLLSRRYNQAALLARALAEDAGKDCIPDALIRRRATGSQGHLGFKERQKNVAGAFTVNDRRRDSLAGKAILLVDDVYTTGATVRECAKALLKGGADRVDVLTLARVAR